MCGGRGGRDSSRWMDGRPEAFFANGLGDRCLCPYLLSTLSVRLGIERGGGAGAAKEEGWSAMEFEGPPGPMGMEAPDTFASRPRWSSPDAATRPHPRNCFVWLVRIFMQIYNVTWTDDMHMKHFGFCFCFVFVLFFSPTSSPNDRECTGGRNGGQRRAGTGGGTKGEVI